MHNVRRQAHRFASAGGGSGNYNPFARTRSRDVPGDEENAVSRTRSTRSERPARRSQAEDAAKEFEGPHHSSTEPTPVTPTFASASATIPESSRERELEHETNGEVKDSAESTVVGSSRQNSSGITKRKIRGIFRHDHEAEGGQEGEDLDRVESEQLSLEERRKKALKKKIPVLAQIRFVLFGAWINVLLVFVPVGFAINYAHINKPVIVFIINFIAIIPLAAMLSNATEELALRVGETVGGLLNASFGNAVELIVSIQALIQNQFTIVKTSLIGSMLSNLLLVMGMSFFLGGINRLEQFFNVTVAQTAASLLALCISSLIIPTVFHNVLAQDGTSASDAKKNRELSRGTAILLLIVYGCYLTFQLKTHAAMYNEPSKKVPKRKSSKIHEGAANRGIAAIGAETAAAAGGHGVNFDSFMEKHDQDGDDDDDFEEPSLSVAGALVTLAISTTLVAFCSEFMVSSIDGLTEGGKVSTTFVGLILLPIVGNAAEHATAVTVAMKDKMDLAIGVAIGSSMQIALLVFPLIVTLGWILNKACMTLYFDNFQIVVLFVAILLVNYLIQDGKSHWLEGVLLMVSYIIIALAAWFYPDLQEQC